MEKYKGYKTQIHCPDCQNGVLRVLSSDEVLNMFPMSRAAHWLKSDSVSHTIYIGWEREIWPKPKYVCVYCDICKHDHDMDERSIKRTFNKDVDAKNDAKNDAKGYLQRKPKSVKIKGYGKHFME